MESKPPSSQSIVGYPTREVAKILDMSEAQIRTFVKDGFVAPARGHRREFYFSFQDIVVLRAARDLWRKLPAKRVHRVLRQLKQDLPSGRALAGVQIVAKGNEICVREGGTLWAAESGQALLDFDVSDLGKKLEPLAQANLQAAQDEEEPRSAEEWFELALELEAYALDEAKEACLRVLEIDPDHAEACFCMGRLMYEFTDWAASIEYYHMGLSQQPEDGAAWMSLGILFEELGQNEQAIESYLKAIAANEACTEAHYKVARLYEAQGDLAHAINHLDAYKQVLSSRPGA
jgi:tetratricopeptide (TPR) repeat protein